LVSIIWYFGVGYFWGIFFLFFLLWFCNTNYFVGYCFLFLGYLLIIIGVVFFKLVKGIYKYIFFILFCYGIMCGIPYNIFCIWTCILEYTLYLCRFFVFVYLYLYFFFEYVYKYAYLSIHKCM
jgi:hypothetical protein